MTTATPAQAPRPALLAKAKNVVAVASGKGGVGKTWFSITLSHALARAGRKTLLFDGDLGLANVDIQLGLTPDRDLGGVITGRIGLMQAATRYEEGGFDIVAGRSGTGSLATLPAQRLAQLGSEIVDVAKQYDQVVLDLGAGLDRTVRVLAASAGTTLVITTPEPTALTDAYAYIKVTHADEPTADLRVIVNMATNAAEGQRTYGTLLKACQGFLKISPPLAGIIRRDKKVAECIRRQSPLLTKFPSSDAAQDIEGVVDRLLG
ncbi:MAG: MinD/ParA family protein [Rhodospirillaceae bacterium]|nr:MinD/ParA family protein [Rhodospirillaceae bacterium]